MATGQYLTLVDLARRTDPDGEAADIAELLSQANEIYDDLVWKEGNTNTGHVYTMRTSIPKGWWRFIGQGVPGSKSTTAQGRTNCGDLEMNSTIDLKLVDLGILRLNKVGELVVPVHQRPHGLGEIPVGQARHHQHRFADMRQLVFK